MRQDLWLDWLLYVAWSVFRNKKIPIFYSTERSHLCCLCFYILIALMFLCTYILLKASSCVTFSVFFATKASIICIDSGTCDTIRVSLALAIRFFDISINRYTPNHWSGIVDFNTYRQVSNIRRTKSQHFKDSRIVLRLSLTNPLKPDVKSRMKMQLEQRRQAMLQLHLNNRQFYCLLRCVLYWTFYGKCGEQFCANMEYLLHFIFQWLRARLH